MKMLRAETVVVSFRGFYHWTSSKDIFEIGFFNILIHWCTHSHDCMTWGQNFRTVIVKVENDGRCGGRWEKGRDGALSVEWPLLSQFDSRSVISVCGQPRVSSLLPTPLFLGGVLLCYHFLKTSMQVHNENLCTLLKGLLVLCGE